MAKFWTVSPEWKGETVFLVGGGPSLAAENLELLRGRRVIVINSSWVRVPFADICFFGDGRWWRAEDPETLRLYRGRIPPPPPQYGGSLLASGFAGRIVTTDKGVVHPRVLRLDKRRPPWFSSDPTAVMMLRTSMTAAVNLAVHLGAAEIVLLGLDGAPAPDGRTHHHPDHPWNQRTNCWPDQLADLQAMVEPLKSRGIAVFNGNVNSAVTLWPRVHWESFLGQSDIQAADGAI